MTSGNIGEEEDQQIPVSRLLVVFAAPSSTMFKIDSVNVTPGQMIFVGEYLRVQGIRKLEEEIERQKQAEIVKPDTRIFVPK